MLDCSTTRFFAVSLTPVHAKFRSTPQTSSRVTLHQDLAPFNPDRADANGACFVALGHRCMWSPQSYIILWSRSSRRKVEAIASVFLAIRVAVQLLLLLLQVFQFLSSERYPSPRAGQGTQGDGRSRCRLKSAALPRVRRMRTTRILPPGPYGEAFAGFSAFASSRTNGEALGAIGGALGTCGPVLQSDYQLMETPSFSFYLLSHISDSFFEASDCRACWSINASRHSSFSIRSFSNTAAILSFSVADAAG